jgi:urea ABC transporter ATP-binding protein UrtE
MGRSSALEVPREALLHVRGLHSGYGRIPILTDLSFDVGSGEFVSILGHNGMGKTTLLKALTGRLPTTAGSVSFCGRDVTRQSSTQRARMGVGYVPQGREIFSHLSVLENLQMGSYLNPAKAAVAIEEGLSYFPRLKVYLDRPGGALSGGEQQLLALARCLCGDPKIVLLDEPTEGIQPSIIGEIIETMKVVRKQRPLTVLLVEQNLNFVSALSTRILILRKGTIAGEIPSESVQNPADIQEFIGLS